MIDDIKENKKHISANSGWYVHHLVWIPENLSEPITEDSQWRYFIKVAPIALWEETEKGDIEPITSSFGDTVFSMQTSGFMSNTLNHALIGVYHHDSYRTGDATILPHEYHPLGMLDTEYCKEGVLEEDLNPGLANLKETALRLKEEASEERNSKLFAKKMELEKTKAQIDEELRIATILYEFNESGGGIVL